MARPYAAEMAKLPETFSWAAAIDIQLLRQAIRAAALSPLRVIGSGGSLTSAHALIGLHQRYTGHLAAVATPLEAMAGQLDATVATWLLSASGGNADILTAAKTLILREPRQLGVLCGHETSPLVKFCCQHPFIDLLIYPPPTGKDGFLATNSLFGFTALLTRAYSNEFAAEADWQATVAHLNLLLSDTTALKEWEAATAPLWTRPTTLVLHSPTTRIGAIDLESKFTEAALGHVQIADYRNFAHGRHHWLAKRGETSSVLAFITGEDCTLAERTLGLIPEDIPQAKIVFDGGPNTVSLTSLFAALRITGWAGCSRRIDPGRPGVPQFGRKLYNLRLPRPIHPKESSQLTPRETAAIARKAGVTLGSLPTLNNLNRWCKALSDFLTRLHNTHFSGIVLDYDGTIVDTRHRFQSNPMNEEVTAELIRLTKAGARIAVATGRGKSVRCELQECLPSALWPSVLVGYYNGAEVASLNNDNAPDSSKNVCPALQPLSVALRRQPELSEYANQEDRPYQITLQSSPFLPVSRLWNITHQVIHATGINDVAAVRSSHSVDVLAAGISKLNAVHKLCEMTYNTSILTIGDQGRWPGNDYQLLSEPFALGVDEISADPVTCWNLGRPGQRGVAVTVEYLSALEAENGRLKFTKGSLK